MDTTDLQQASVNSDEDFRQDPRGYSLTYRVCAPNVELGRLGLLRPNFAYPEFQPLGVQDMGSTHSGADKSSWDQVLIPYV